MKSDNMEKLISILAKAESWTSASALSKIIHVDKRTIRNYVNEINQKGSHRIESSSQGYKLQKQVSAISTEEYDDVKERPYKILYSLLSHRDGISVFDLAEDLNVSESTIANDITFKLKQTLKQYHLEIVSHDYIYLLNGKEQNKRRLIGYLVTQSSNTLFSTTNFLKLLSPEVDVDALRKTILGFCESCHLAINDYAFNNLLIHIIVIFIRVKSDNALTTNDKIYNIDQLLSKSNQRENILCFVNKIVAYCKEVSGKEVQQNDLEQIILLVLLSVEQLRNKEIDLHEFADYIDKDFFNQVINIIIDMNRRYYLPDMDNDFLCQFVVHVFNLYQRSIYHISYPNPIAAQIKKDYAPVWDMAVFFSHYLAQAYDINISEDEIGFIAFHFGSYLQNHKNSKVERIPCLLVIDDYHSFGRALVHELHLSFNDDLHIVDTISSANYSAEKYRDAADIIISTTIQNFHHNHAIIVNPIITSRNLKTIRKEIDVIRHETKYKETIKFLNYIFKECLYFRNVYKENVEDYIRFLGNAAKKKGYIGDDYIEDALKREHFSSTAFTDHIAIPHGGVSTYATESFIAVLHNDHPIPWSNKNINFILFIGIAEDEMKYFRGVLDMIVEVFSSVEHTFALLKTDTFPEFISELTKIR